ncbi:cell wall mannoprotein 1 family protein [Aspergillus lucknowensis]|uniref:Antigenic cell wall galactomanno protein n=1 Tax=Aspergillus lucknowensis TaxID=176173 RepID=A0ABR4LNE6_9EURO
MRFFVPLISSFLVASLALANLQTLQGDITSIGRSLTALDNVVNVLPSGAPGIPVALQVQVHSVTLANQLKLAAQHANSTNALNLTDSLSLGVGLIALLPGITGTLSDVAEKNTTFAGLGIIVLSSLVQLKGDTEAFSDQLVAKLDPLIQAVSPLVVNTIIDAFDNAIAAFRSNGEHSLPVF